MNSHFDREAWAKLSLFEQLGNIGSEVGRALSAKRRGDIASRDAALARGLDLIDASAEQLAKQHSPKTRELLRARELFAQSVMTTNEDSTIEAYFFNYALAARSNR